MLNKNRNHYRRKKSRRSYRVRMVMNPNLESAESRGAAQAVKKAKKNVFSLKALIEKARYIDRKFQELFIMSYYEAVNQASVFAGKAVKMTSNTLNKIKKNK